MSRARGFFKNMSVKTLIDYISEKHQGETLSEFAHGRDTKAYYRALELDVIESLIKNGVLLRSKKANGHFKKMKDDELLDFVKSRHNGKTISQLQTCSDRRVYEIARQRGLIKRLVDEGILVRTRGEIEEQPAFKINKDLRKKNIEEIEKRLGIPLKEFLQREYVIKERTSEDIGKEIGKSGAGVRGYLEHFSIAVRGRSIHWNPEKVNKTYDSVKAELGRVPTIKDLIKRGYGGLFNTLSKRNIFGDNVKTYTDYVIMRGDSPNLGRNWTQETVNEVYDTIKKEKGRVPKQKDFKGNEGALRAIESGIFGEEVHTLGTYVNFRGDCSSYVRGKWTPQFYNECYDKLKTSLGRVPTVKEFNTEYGSSQHPLKAGIFGQSIKTYNDYVIFRGDKPNGRGNLTTQSQSISQKHGESLLEEWVND